MKWACSSWRWENILKTVQNQNLRTVRYVRYFVVRNENSIVTVSSTKRPSLGGNMQPIAESVLKAALYRSAVKNGNIK